VCMCLGSSAKFLTLCLDAHNLAVKLNWTEIANPRWKGNDLLQFCCLDVQCICCWNHRMTPNSKSCLDAASNWNWKGAGRGAGRGGLGVSQGEATHAAVPLSSMLPAAVPLPAREGPPQAVVPLQDRWKPPPDAAPLPARDRPPPGSASRRSPTGQACPATFPYRRRSRVRGARRRWRRGEMG
jgi:hypothetical protein